MKPQYRRNWLGAGVYAALLLISLCLFYAERSRTRPSGAGVLLGPLNYLCFIYEFGVTGFGIAINVVAMCASFLLGGVNRRVMMILSAGIWPVWLILGLIAFIMEGEFPCPGDFFHVFLTPPWVD